MKTPPRSTRNRAPIPGSRAGVRKKTRRVNVPRSSKRAVERSGVKRRGRQRRRP